MRGKRSKQYRKLMFFYQQTFGFREPYQILVDSNMLIDTHNCKMELIPALERTLQTKGPKMMITHCSMRHMYNHQPSLPDELVDYAKRFEKRRCNHHELEQPLSERECLESVVIHNGHNKHRYVVAAQDPEIRQMLREIPGVPLIYVKRSVMIMEPMADVSADVKEKAEKEKFRVGLKDKPKTMKRKREEVTEGGEGGEGVKETEEEKKKKRKKGPKGPNPLSVKKSKDSKPKPEDGVKAEGEGGHKRKRKRKTAASSNGGTAEGPLEGGGVSLTAVKDEE